MSHSASYATFEVRPANPVIGAEIEGVDLREPLEAATIAELRDALHRWKVLFFRGQEIDNEQLLRFGRYFGPLTPAHPIASGLPDFPQIWEREAVEFRNRRREKDAGIPRYPVLRDSMGWHIDITFTANPTKYSILQGVEIPPYGGDTVWANLAAAYEGLSPAMQQLVDGLQALHCTSIYEYSAPKAGAATAYKALHPLVRVHPDTGEKVLFLNPDAMQHVVGLKASESRAVIDLLFDEVTRPEYQVRFRWTPNAVVIWDNQATAHNGPIDYDHFVGRRLVRRITVAGDLPVGPDGFQSLPLEGPLFDAIG